MATAEPEVPVTEQPLQAEKLVKEKKPKVTKEKKPKQPKPAAHPPYFQMIKEAILALNEKSGSSPYAIAKYMEEKQKAVLPANFRKILALQLKNSTARGKLIKIKASYKLSEAGKKATKAKTEKKAKPAAKPKKAEATKKPAKRVGAKKKSTPAKPKQPKSIKSVSAKRAKKTTA
ncbi:Histone H1 [Hibiscus syriacus]|uniref:Histone H1 n=1 Tax=Hibiscus syriacus TaxID=106335 RepID=A0A6A3D7D4_HIBSY|nr:histone H1-like [Hibiscus syriacus]KAE8735848.1 Histone H1 [Hibiscus syriacus]